MMNLRQLSDEIMRDKVIETLIEPIDSDDHSDDAGAMRRAHRKAIDLLFYNAGFNATLLQALVDPDNVQISPEDKAHARQYLDMLHQDLSEFLFPPNPDSPLEEEHGEAGY